MSNDLIDNYDEKNVQEVLSAVDDGDFSEDELRDIRDYEQENKNRSTVTSELNNVLGDEGDSDIDTDTEYESTPAADAETGSGTEPGTAANEPPSVPDRGEESLDTDSVDRSPQEHTTLGTERDEQSREALPTREELHEMDDNPTVTIVPRVARIGRTQTPNVYTPTEVELTEEIRQAIVDGRAVLADDDSE